MDLCGFMWIMTAGGRYRPQSCVPRSSHMVGYSHPTIGSLKAEVKMPKKLWPGWKTMFRATTAGIPSNPGDLDGVSAARNQAWEQAIPLAHSFQATSHDPGIWLGFSSSPFQPWWQRQGQECWVSQPIAQCHSISFQHISDQGLQKWHQVQHPSQLRQWNGHNPGCLNLACSFREEWNRKGRGKERDSISGWWWTYPSEKYESQLGWFQTEWNVIKNKRWSQTTNQDWFIVGQSYYCYISLLL